MNGFIDSKARALLNNYKLTPATLAHKLDPTWMPSPWLMYVSTLVATELRKGNARIIISAPPRHGKSRLITTFTSIWIQEIFKTMHIILTSYGGDLAADFGREVRNIILANEEYLDVRIAPDKSQAKAWKNQWGGGMASVGLGGAITGRGAHVLVIDDFIKEIKEALSSTHREYIWNWFSTTAFTRIEPGGSCIIIATRWHHDDLIGRILKYNPGGAWKYIHIPAIALNDDILGRQPGEALFPERFDLKALEERKETLGTFFFNALYQQQPENPDAKITDAGWLGIVDFVPNLEKLPQARVWDFAATPDGGDYAVGGNFAYDASIDTLYILNIIRVQKSPGQIEQLVRKTAVADGTKTKIYIEQEPGSSGKMLTHHYNETVLPEFNVEAVPATDGKLSRAQPMLAAAEAGKVKLVKALWNQIFIDEFKDFPGSDYDDQVDITSIAYNKMSGKSSYSASWGRHNNSVRTETHQQDPNTHKSKGGVIVPSTSGVTWRTKAI